MSSLIVDVEARAGASDQDRDAWLAQRRTGITATEAKRLMLGEPAELLALEKVMGAPFEGNRYTQWGKLREPFIAASVSREMPYLHEEHRVFHARNQPRHLASPDMIGVRDDGSLILSEIKTSGRDLSNVAVYDSTGYFFQMQWQMYVLEATSCWMVAEVHDGQWDYHNPLSIDEFNREREVLDTAIPEQRARLDYLVTIQQCGNSHETPGMLYPPIYRDVPRDDDVIQEMIDRVDAALLLIDEVSE